MEHVEDEVATWCRLRNFVLLFDAGMGTLAGRVCRLPWWGSAARRIQLVPRRVGFPWTHRPPRRSSSVEPCGWTMTTTMPARPGRSRSAEPAGEHTPRRPRRRSPGGELARPHAASPNNFLVDLAAGERMTLMSIG
jgi:hypothetical protein